VEAREHDGGGKVMDKLLSAMNEHAKKTREGACQKQKNRCEDEAVVIFHHAQHQKDYCREVGRTDCQPYPKRFILFHKHIVYDASNYA
jgi:hypothetical protein